MARTLYRVVKHDPPTLADFASSQARGRPPGTSHPDAQRLWGGLSVFATEAQARRKGRVSPAIGTFIARLEVPDGSAIRAERTLPRSPGHHTLWGDPAELLACVVAVVPVAPGR